MNQDRKKKRALWIRLVQLALLAVVCLFVGRMLVGDIAKVRWSDLDFAPGYLALGVLLTGGASFFMASAYRCTLSSVAITPSWRVMLASTWISQMGRYIPGKVFTVAGLAYILGRYGMNVAVAAAMVLVNTSISVTFGFVVASPLMLWEPLRSQVPLAWLWTLLVIVAGAICVHPRVFFPLMDAMLRRLGRQKMPSHPRLRSYILPVLHQVGRWICMGAGLWFMVRSVAPVGIENIWLFIAASALAVTAGFVALFAPAGLGVREFVYLLVLGAVIGPPKAAVVTVGVRLVTIVVEVLMALAGLVMLHLHKPEMAASDGD